MAITYKRPFMDSSTKVPVLHKVYYGAPAKQFFNAAGHAMPMMYPRHDLAVIEWCENNCQAAWYRSPDYTDRTFIEFEDSEDAVMFALRWVK